MRGGANGARVSLAPQKGWEVNDPDDLDRILSKLVEIRAEFGNEKISFADLIVLGGATAIEKAAEEAGVSVDVSFVSGQGDASQTDTDIASFALLEPASDAFRNYFDPTRASGLWKCS